MAEISTEVSFKLLCSVQDYLGTFFLNDYYYVYH